MLGTQVPSRQKYWPDNEYGQYPYKESDAFPPADRFCGGRHQCNDGTRRPRCWPAPTILGAGRPEALLGLLRPCHMSTEWPRRRLMGPVTAPCAEDPRADLLAGT